MKTSFELAMNRMRWLGALIFASLGIGGIVDTAHYPDYPGQSYLPGIVMLLGGLGLLLIPARKLTPESIKRIEADPINAAADRHPGLFFVFYFCCGVTALVIFGDLLPHSVGSSLPRNTMKYFVPAMAATGVTIGQRLLRKSIKKMISQQGAGGYGSPAAGSPPPQPCEGEAPSPA